MSRITERSSASRRARASIASRARPAAFQARPATTSMAVGVALLDTEPLDHSPISGRRRVDDVVQRIAVGQRIEHRRSQRVGEQGDVEVLGDLVDLLGRCTTRRRASSSGRLLMASGRRTGGPALGRGPRSRLRWPGGAVPELVGVHPTAVGHLHEVLVPDERVRVLVDDGRAPGRRLGPGLRATTGRRLQRPTDPEAEEGLGVGDRGPQGVRVLAGPGRRDHAPAAASATATSTSWACSHS